MEQLITYTLLVTAIYFALFTILLKPANLFSVVIFKVIPATIAIFALIGFLFRIGVVMQIAS